MPPKAIPADSTTAVASETADAPWHMGWQGFKEQLLGRLEFVRLGLSGSGAFGIWE